jgi:hypothetical protein
MDRDSLSLRFEADSDGTGKLLASVRFRGFSGHGGAWLDVTALEEFANAVAVYPIPSHKRTAIAGGFWNKDVRGELQQEHLAIAVYGIGNRGQVAVQVRIASELWEGDRPDSQRTVKVELLTTHQRLGDFSRQLRSLIGGETETAILEADVLS